MATNAHDVDDEPSPWTRPLFLASAAVIGLIAILGVALVFTGGSTDAGPQRPAAPEAQPSPAADSTPRGCGPQEVDQGVPSRAPTATWVLRGRLAVPTAPGSVGPRATRSGVPSCFAHSPTGALFATVNAYGMLSILARRPHSKQVAGVRHLIASGAGREAALAATSRQGDSTPSSIGVQVAGFAVIRYEATSSVIDLAFRVVSAAGTGYVHAAVTMRWERGDWKLVLSQAGQPFDSMQAVADLTGYIPWSGA